MSLVEGPPNSIPAENIIPLISKLTYQLPDPFLGEGAGTTKLDCTGQFKAVGSKNELVRPYSHFETLVQAPLVDLVRNQEQC